MFIELAAYLAALDRLLVAMAHDLTNTHNAGTLTTETHQALDALTTARDGFTRVIAYHHNDE